jgi:predicted RNA-binding protein with PUA-like domain
MNHWLLKSEPSAYSWNQLVSEQVTGWDGVRNHQAAANLRAMAVGDLAFFYHSNIGLEIVGVCQIVEAAYPDPSDPQNRFVMVDVAPCYPLNKPVRLAQLKTDPSLSEMAMLRQSRLSVSRVTPAEWHRILALAAG